MITVIKLNIHNRIKFLIKIVVLYVFLIGCSNGKHIISNDFSSDIYASSQRKLLNEDYHGAIKELEMLDRYYPFSPYSQQVQFDLIYAYYKLPDFMLEKLLIDRFLRLNPVHKNIDYVLYMRGLTAMSLDNIALKGLLSFLNMNTFDRNPDNANEAFYIFSNILNNYPKSRYAMDTYKRLIYLKNRLAKHELSIVLFYSKLGVYIAVINRVENMLKNFPDTEATRKALPHMEKAYKKLKLIKQAEKVEKIIKENLY